MHCITEMGRWVQTNRDIDIDFRSVAVVASGWSKSQKQCKAYFRHFEALFFAVLKKYVHLIDYLLSQSNH